MLDGLELVDMCELKIGLDLVLAQPLQVLDVRRRRGVGNHVLIRRLHRRVGEQRPPDVVGGGQR